VEWVYDNGRRDSVLIRYYPEGDLRNHFGADDASKQRRVTQLAIALAELNAAGFIHPDLKCDNIVIDESSNIALLTWRTLVVQKHGDTAKVW
jgi:serine/threonine protein kinase